MTPRPEIRIAITREVSRSIARCELTHHARSPIDVERARAEHAAYERALTDAGCRVERLPEAPDLPDAVFVEDTAVVLDRLAILTRPGAVSRRAEVDAVGRALAPHRPLVRLRAPATLDGGDVLVAGRCMFVGRSRRTNAAGLAQLREATADHVDRLIPVEVERCLHLKSAVTSVGDDLLLIDRAWVDPDPFRGFRLVEVDPSESGGGNALRIGDRVVYSEAYPRTRERLERAGVHVVAVPASELAKAEGGVTCCSVIVEHYRRGGGRSSGSR